MALIALISLNLARSCRSTSIVIFCSIAYFVTFIICYYFSLILILLCSITLLKNLPSYNTWSMTSVIGSKIHTRRVWQGVHVICIPCLVGVAFQVSEISFLFVDLQICLKFPLPKNKMGSKNYTK